MGADRRPDPLTAPDRPPAPTARAPRALWLALAAGALVLTGLQFATPGLIGVDAYFHVRYAAVMREAGLAGFPPPFPWLPLTILAPDRYADHHLLYHVYLVPFTLGDLRLGGKLAGLVGALAFLATFAWLVRRERVPLPWLAILALGAASADFLYRISMTRVQALSLVCLLVGFECALRRRHRTLAVVACLYTWLYDGFALLAVPLGAVGLADLVVERRLRLGATLAALSGVAAGLVVNPYFPEYLEFILHHFGAKLVPGEAVRVGREWFPYDPVSLLGNAGMALLYLAFGLAHTGPALRRDRRALAALAMAAVFLVLTLGSKRFIEYFAPTATVFVVLAASGAVAHLRPAARGALVALLVVVAVGNVAGVGWTLVRKDAEAPGDRYARVAEYVAREAPPGAMLCTTDWDDFPRLYFYNVASTYLVGLDPTYLQRRFRSAYWQWVDITQGQVPEPSRLLATRFPCAYIMTDRHHPAFLEQALHDPGLERVLEDPHAVLFRVRRDGPPPVYPRTLD